MKATKNAHDWHCEDHETYGWRGDDCMQCRGCIICDQKELNELRECFDCGKQFLPPPYESQKNSRCCELCASYA